MESTIAPRHAASMPSAAAAVVVAVAVVVVVVVALRQQSMLHAGGVNPPCRRFLQSLTQLLQLDCVHHSSVFRRVPDLPELPEHPL